METTAVLLFPFYCAAVHNNVERGKWERECPSPVLVWAGSQWERGKKVTQPRQGKISVHIITKQLSAANAYILL